MSPALNAAIPGGCDSHQCRTPAGARGDFRQLWYCAVTVIAIMPLIQAGFAQSTIFNIPTTDTVAKGKAYFEFDLLPQLPKPERAPRLYLVNPRLVIGVAKNLEAGSNFSTFVNSTACSSTPVTCGYAEPNVKWRFLNRDNSGMAAAAGGLLHTPVNSREGQDSWGVLYALVSKKVKTGNNGPRFHGGPYGIVPANENPVTGPINFVGPHAGVILGYEQPVRSDLKIVADWFSGKNYYGYLTPGVSITLPHSSSLNIGYAIGNDSYSEPGNNNRFLFIYYGITFPQGRFYHRSMGKEYRRDPERILAEIQREERRQKRGRLKIFLGYASGVGKSTKMLDEARRRKKRGEDVVVGATQPQCSAEIERLLSLHEVIPTLKISGRDVIDLERILRRRPQVVVIDGLAYDNPPGSRHAHRWQEIEELMRAGISVVTSINLQYIDEMQEEVACITGKRPSETVPIAFLKRADDIEIVDAPATEQRSSRLREMALLAAAEVVESELRDYLTAHHIEENWGIQERILVGITPRSDARPILESGRRNADRFHGDLLVAYVRQEELSAEDQASLDKNLGIARELGAAIHVLDGRDPVRALIDFARKEGVTQIFIGHSQRRDWWHRLRGNPVDRLIDLADGIDVRVFPQRVLR